MTILQGLCLCFINHGASAETLQFGSRPRRFCLGHPFPVSAWVSLGRLTTEHAG